MTTLLSSFHRLSPAERIDHLRKVVNLSKEEAEILASSRILGIGSADGPVENVIGVMPVPLGIAAGFVVNGREYLVPMATEQQTVISMATKGAELTQPTGGFKASSTESIMTGQIQLTKVRDHEKAKERILADKEAILAKANTESRTRKAVDVQVRTLETLAGPMLVVELLVDVKDSMGANVVDSMCETVAPLMASLAEGRVNLRIVSNLATRRMVHVETLVSKEAVGGAEIVDRIAEACAFAESDPFRAATHNKGIMNGVSAVLLATNNDHRAVEAGAHAYAAMTGRYMPLSRWSRSGEENLVGELVMPMAVGTKGGAIQAHPTARIALKILGAETAAELGEVAASAGLAYNLAALQALVTTGIESVK